MVDTVQTSSHGKNRMNTWNDDSTVYLGLFSVFGHLSRDFKDVMVNEYYFIQNKSLHFQQVEIINFVTLEWN